MGKKLDALLGRTFKTNKFKPLANLAISRLAVLKQQRHVRCSQARSDVLQLLEQGHHERALLRVEQVIKEQNMLDVFVMTESYCNLVIERVHLIEQERECPDELKEAISSLLFAASRCGDFPELQEIRVLFTSRYGKEFAARAIELRNNCGVNHRMIQKLSTRMPDLESRMKFLKEIAAEKSIVLQLEEGSSLSTEEKTNVSKASTSSGSATLGDDMPMAPEDNNEGFSDSMKARTKYKDVADAAQAAFESAAYAAAAARVAVELSRSHSHDPDDQGSPNLRERKTSDRNEPKKQKSKLENKENHSENQAEGMKRSVDAAELKSVISNSSLNTADDIVEVAMMASDKEDPSKLLEKEIVFDESDNETNHSNDMKSSSGYKLKTGPGYSQSHTGGISKLQGALKLPFSARTRGVRGY
ncbi:Ist1 domain-containing protein [Cephalotus follicularis]|uniref:Ist1 domain-containing protein n=1 Tax=Cephalotus follicularis TaxID=3775 RepID=A0A1Q3AUG0_CEPFO|nr:Ist1 domain-containing protein [Cephalotus follicularis]